MPWTDSSCAIFEKKSVISRASFTRRTCSDGHEEISLHLVRTEYRNIRAINSIAVANVNHPGQPGGHDPVRTTRKQ